MTRISHLIAGMAAAAVVLLAGCAVDNQAGVAARDPGVVTTGPAAAGSDPGSTTSDTGECDDVTYSDPWIAFAPSLRDGDELSVGGQGWISSIAAAADVEVSGDVGVVEVTDKSAPTLIECGQVTGTVDWVQVDAVGPGTVTLVVGESSMTITVV